MKYVNREMKIDQIIGYFNDKKINLLPPFQRGSVWKINHRLKLIENMVKERPIPAIFFISRNRDRNSATTSSMVNSAWRA
jgi:hypothetical protein